jgi:hypothetical protein
MVIEWHGGGMALGVRGEDDEERWVKTKKSLREDEGKLGRRLRKTLRSV